MTDTDPDVEFLAPGTPIDLSNCEREPIHVPGSVQPRGVLIAVSDPDFVVQQVSENLADLVAARPRPRSAATGTTCSVSRTARPCSSSATSWAATPGPPPAWRSCGACCAGSRSTAATGRPACSATSTPPSQASSSVPWPPCWSAGWNRTADRRAGCCCAGPAQVTCQRSSSIPTGSSGCWRGRERDRTEQVDALRPGSTVLLYTDGLVERRGQGFDDGVTLLGEAVAALRELPVGPMCDALLARLLPERSMDDVALVAVRLRD